MLPDDARPLLLRSGSRRLDILRDRVIKFRCSLNAQSTQQPRALVSESVRTAASTSKILLGLQAIFLLAQVLVKRIFSFTCFLSDAAKPSFL